MEMYYKIRVYKNKEWKDQNKFADLYEFAFRPEKLLIERFWEANIFYCMELIELQNNYIEESYQR